VRFLFQLGPLQRAELRFGQHQPFLGGLCLQRLQALVHGLEVVAQPDATYPLWRDAEGVAFEHLVGNTDLAVSGQFQRQFDHRCLDLRIHAVLQKRAVVGDFLQGRFTALVVQLPETVEAVAGIAHYPAGLTDIAQLPRQFEHADLGADDFLFLSHGGLLAVRRARCRFGLRPPRPRATARETDHCQI
jgi:hypothetical protein